MNGMVWMGIQLFQKVTSFKLNTTLISLAEFVSLINFTLLPQALPEKAKKWATFSILPQFSRSAFCKKYCLSFTQKGFFSY